MLSTVYQKTQIIGFPFALPLSDRLYIKQISHGKLKDQDQQLEQIFSLPILSFCNLHHKVVETMMEHRWDRKSVAAYRIQSSEIIVEGRDHLSKSRGNLTPGYGLAGFPI
jgi:hypothetical protein